MKFQSWVTMSNCVANDFHGHMISLMARADLQNDDESSDDALFTKPSAMQSGFLPLANLGVFVLTHPFFEHFEPVELGDAFSDDCATATEVAQGSNGLMEVNVR